MQQMKSREHMDQSKKKRKCNYFIRVSNAMKQLQEQVLYLLKWQFRESMKANSSLDFGTVKGHFWILAYNNGETKKFLVALRYLSHPPFVKLLEAAEQEFGFEQKGVIVIPCEASQLQRILSENTSANK